MRIGGGGGGWSAITGNTYPIKTEAVAPSSASGMTAQEVEALLSDLDPSAVTEAGKAHTAAARPCQRAAGRGTPPPRPAALPPAAGRARRPRAWACRAALTVGSAR